MNKGRHSNFSPVDPTHAMHPVCALDWRSLRDVPALLVWVVRHREADDLQITAEVAGHPGLFAIVSGLRAAGFDPVAAARQIADDCFLAGVDLRDKRRLIQRFVEAVYAFLHSLSRKSR